MKHCSFLILLINCTFLSTPLSARTIHVHPDSVVTRIQDGINIAEHGDTVMVFPGTYFEHDIDFLGKAIVLTSTDPLDSAVVTSTTINASSLGPVFYLHSGEDITSVITGFTITGGFNNRGGGIECSYSSSATVERNIITGNTASDHGGAILCGSNCRSIITNNIISHNTVIEGPGGGISCTTNSSPIIANNVIQNNSTVGWASGGGLVCSAAEPLITNNTIINNISGYGGGISCNNSTIEVNNTIFWGNEGTVQGKEMFIGDEWTPSILSISYSDVEGGQSSVFVGGGCTLNWGDGMVDTIPSFRWDGFHLTDNSPLHNAGDPDYPGDIETDIDGERRVQEERIDIGVDEIRVIHIRDENPPAVIDPRAQSKSLE